jgi:hypothetical protein
MAAGRQVTDAQVKELRRNLNQGAPLKRAAMKADMDRKTARKYRELGQLPSEAPTAHDWPTRADPLVDVWPRLQELLEQDAGIQAVTLLQWLQTQQPEQDWQRHRRTLERRVRVWRAEHGPAKEVFFSQVHEPGRLGSSDFTHMDSLGVTIAGQAFPHLMYHFVLTCSNWEDVTLCFSESFASFSEGFQNAVWVLGAVPERHRTDRMTLAVHHDGNLERYTAKYQGVMAHYGVTPEATNPYSGHENGDCEQGHRRFKEALDQALRLRGSRDFASRAEYMKFVRGVVARRNAAKAVKFQEELARLRPLPTRRLETLERQTVRVGQGSTIQVKKNTYSVPARLMGERVEARIGAEVIEVWYAGVLQQTMERLRGQSKHRIDYRHVIDWLVRKPGAFARYVYRADLYPTVTFRRAYDALVAQQPTRADREYVRILHLAAQHSETGVEEALAKLLEQNQPVSEQAVRTCLGQATGLSVAAGVSVLKVDLGAYDALREEWAQNSAKEMYQESQGDANKEVNDEQGREQSPDQLPTGTALGDDAEPVRGGGAASDGGVVELPGLPSGTDAARVPTAAAQSDRTAAEGIAVAVGEELVGAGSEASAGESGAAIARSVERGVLGSARERFGIRSTGLGQDARPVCGVTGTGAGGPIGAEHEVQPVGAGVAEGQAGLASEGNAAGPVALGRPADRRPGLRATEPRGDGSAVHAVGGALRAGQCVGDEQPGVLAMGADLQGSDDDGRGDRPVGASQRDRGAEHPELSCGVGEANARSTITEGGVRGEVRPWRGPGSATGSVAGAPAPVAEPGPHHGKVCLGGAGNLNCR